MPSRNHSLPGQQLAPIRIPFIAVPRTRGQRYYNPDTNQILSRRGALNQVAQKYGFRSYSAMESFSAELRFERFGQRLGGIGGLLTGTPPAPFDVTRMYRLARRWEKENKANFAGDVPWQVKDLMSAYINAPSHHDRMLFLADLLDKITFNGVKIRDKAVYGAYLPGETPKSKKGRRR